MRFCLTDRIAELEPGARIVTLKSLSMAEEYLADHFPNFPVMPGVLMLEAMTQASAWLVRVTDNFAHSMVVLKSARNVKYGRFIEPGQTLYVTSQLVKQNGNETTFKARGVVNGIVAVSARLVLRSYNWADLAPERSEADQVTIAHLRELFNTLYRPEPRAVEQAQPVTVPSPAAPVS